MKVDVNVREELADQPKPDGPGVSLVFDLLREVGASFRRAPERPAGKGNAASASSERSASLGHGAVGAALNQGLGPEEARKVASALTPAEWKLLGRWDPRVMLTLLRHFSPYKQSRFLLNATDAQVARLNAFGRASNGRSAESNQSVLKGLLQRVGYLAVLNLSSSDIALLLKMRPKALWRDLDSSMSLKSLLKALRLLGPDEVMRLQNWGVGSANIVALHEYWGMPPAQIATTTIYDVSALHQLPADVVRALFAGGYNVDECLGVASLLRSSDLELASPELIKEFLGWILAHRRGAPLRDDLAAVQLGFQELVSTITSGNAAQAWGWEAPISTLRAIAADFAALSPEERALTQRFFPPDRHGAEATMRLFGKGYTAKDLVRLAQQGRTYDELAWVMLEGTSYPALYFLGLLAETNPVEALDISMRTAHHYGRCPDRPTEYHSPDHFRSIS